MVEGSECLELTWTEPTVKSSCEQLEQMWVQWEARLKKQRWKQFFVHKQQIKNILSKQKLLLVLSCFRERTFSYCPFAICNPFFPLCYSVVCLLKGQQRRMQPKDTQSLYSCWLLLACGEATILRGWRTVLLFSSLQSQCPVSKVQQQTPVWVLLWLHWQLVLRDYSSYRCRIFSVVVYMNSKIRNFCTVLLIYQYYRLHVPNMAVMSALHHITFFL